jgi:hypothetical protein
MKQAIFIFAVLVLAFSAMGEGFSSYSDTVGVDASVQTGTVALGIASLNALSDGSQLFPGLQTVNPQANQAAAADITTTSDGNIGGTSSDLQTVNPQAGQVTLAAGTITTSDGNWKGRIGGSSYFDSLNVNAYNCRPGFSPGLQLEIANLGTLPARLSELSLDWGYLTNSVTLCNWSLTSPDGALTGGTDAQSLQEALQQVVIAPQAMIDLAVQMQFAGTVAEGACAVTMQYDRWNVDTPGTGDISFAPAVSVGIDNPNGFNRSTRLHDKPHPSRAEKRGGNHRLPGKPGNGRRHQLHGRTAGQST